MNTTWKLAYPLYDRDQQQRCRHHYELLRQDSHVASATLTSIPEYCLTEITVEFREGFNQPFRHEIRALDRRYPNVRPDHARLDVLVEKAQAAPDAGAFLRHEAIPAEHVYLSGEFSAKYQHFPHDLRVGAWYRRRGTGFRLQVVKLCPGEISSVVLHGWRMPEDLLEVVVLETFVSSFEPCEAPVEGEHWLMRLSNDVDPFA
jgi:hypothetical protein